MNALEGLDWPRLTRRLELRPATVAATAAQTLAAQLQVYPNPATGSVWVALPAGLTATGPVTLTNALGQTVRRQLVAATTQGQPTELSVRDLAPGVYQLHLTVAGTALVRRVVVQ